MIIILVSTGVFQDYIIYNIRQLKKLGYKVYVITEEHFFNRLEGYNVEKIDSNKLVNNFDSKSKLEKGYWSNCSKRLFFLYECMKKYNLENVIHLENDVLLYTKMEYNLESKIYLAMDNNKRCVPGIIFIPKYEMLNNLISNYDYTITDMYNMANFYNNNKEIVDTFPIIDDSISSCKYNKNFKLFNNSIFDAAAMGQYLGGIGTIHAPGDSSGFVSKDCIIKYNKYTFHWIKKGDDYFPYININNKFIAINNLHIHSKNLREFIIENPIENKYINKYINFITGEKIQCMCDNFIGKTKDFNDNPLIKNYSDKFINFGSNLSINNGSKIFCYTHLLDDINILISTLNNLMNNFILVFHNSDNEFNNNHLVLFDKIPNLKYIYTQNMNVIDDRVKPLPIGLSNSVWEHGNKNIYNKVYNMNIKKTKNIYFNFSVGTNREKREKCKTLLLNKGLVWSENRPYEEYLIELKKHKYAICPEGNGIDTHRFWECLYMNTIPICIKNILVDHYKKLFPIIVLNSWEEFNLDKLKEYNNSIDHLLLSLDSIKYPIYTEIDTFKNNLFDIVICVGPNDKKIIMKQLYHTKRNIIGYRNIYLIISNPNVCYEGCINIDEKIFPFNIETISHFHSNTARRGWYLQQLLKLYVGKVIPDILDRYLVIDADTIFIKPTEFIKNNKCLYDYGKEYYKYYFDHMLRLSPIFTKVFSNKSGICHHMMFEKKYINEIIEIVEKKHKDIFYNVFLKLVTNQHHSGASEYELYFNYIFKYHKDNVEIRSLNSSNNRHGVNKDTNYYSQHWYHSK